MFTIIQPLAINHQHFFTTSFTISAGKGDPSRPRQIWAFPPSFSPRNRLQQVNAKMAQQQQTQEISPQKWKEAPSLRRSSLPRDLPQKWDLSTTWDTVRDVSGAYA